MLFNKDDLSLLNGFLSFLCILPFLLGLLVIIGFSTNVPHVDQWDHDVRHMIMFFEGNFTTGTFLEVHNDHRPLIPRLVYYPVEFITQGNFQALALIGYIIHALSFLLIIHIIRGWFASKKSFLLCILPLSIFWFNLHLVSNLLTGLSIDHALCVFFAILSSVYMARSRNFDRFFFISILSAVFCMFSFSAGILIWVAGFFVLLFQRKEKYLFKAAFWMTCALLCIIWNYIIMGYPSEGRHGIAGYYAYIANFIQYLPYKVSNVIGSLGSQIFGFSYTGLIFGIILIILIGSVIIINSMAENEEIDGRILFLLLFSLLTCAAIAITRSGQGTDFGAVERFLFNTEGRQYPVSFLVIPSLYLFFVKSYLSQIVSLAKNETSMHLTVQKKNLNISFGLQVILVAFTGLMLLSSIGNDVFGGHEAFQWVTNHNEQYLEEYLTTDDRFLTKIHPNPDVVRKYAPQLEKYHLSVFKKD